MIRNKLFNETYWKILEKLYEREEEIKKGATKKRYYLKTLAKALGRRDPTISEPLSDLKKMGFVIGEKKGIEKGGLREDLILTDEGKFFFEVNQPPKVEIIKSVIKQLKEELHKMPTVDEIAVRMGKSPEDQSVRYLIYAVGKTVDWHPPDLMKPSDFDQFKKHVVSIERTKKKGKKHPV